MMHVYSHFYCSTEAEGDCPSHVVVICKGRFFKMEAVHTDGDLLTPPEFMAHFSHIREVCDQEDPAPGLGALTGDDRTNWAQVSLFVIVLHPSNIQGDIRTGQVSDVVIIVYHSPMKASHFETRTLT